MASTFKAGSTSCFDRFRGSRGGCICFDTHQSESLSTSAAPIDDEPRAILRGGHVPDLYGARRRV